MFSKPSCALKQILRAARGSRRARAGGARQGNGFRSEIFYKQAPETRATEARNICQATAGRMRAAMGHFSAVDIAKLRFVGYSLLLIRRDNRYAGNGVFWMTFKTETTTGT